MANYVCPRWRSLAFRVCLVVALTASCRVSAQEQKSGIPPAPQNDARSSVRLGAGDLVEVSVYNVPELTTKARISNQGDVHLPLVDYAHLAGLTSEEAEGVIERRLAD